ncbi:pentatricopeptide repeat-containing protein At5g06540-like [Ziziphus jujuba]|uniref:Pentatricopeptide repeat-containing protein At5g06540-like n=1 Tax=Ziziphus jujuba TaxID=326968 RepID=A0A6P4A3H9_ZIZJJ|nr:pentatricopeptide repeat-containing protein At5g06540-like [Ziziphus jujuba]
MNSFTVSNISCMRVADQLPPQIAIIREKLSEILKNARLGGYIANTMQVSFDLIEEEEEQVVACHSEKLAIAFGLMSTEPGTPIWIAQNLRTCDDCHSALKAIYKVYKRELTVQDRSRFHTFKDGICLCNDYGSREFFHCKQSSLHANAVVNFIISPISF